MTRYYKADDIVKIVDEIAGELQLDVYGIDFQPLYDIKAKVPCTIVKANELTEFSTEKKDLVFIVCSKDVFEGVDKDFHPLCDEKQKYMWIRNEMEKVKIDPEKEKFGLNNPCVTIPLSFLESVDQNLVVNSAKMALYVMAQVEELKKERAAEEKAKKKKEGKIKRY